MSELKPSSRMLVISACCQCPYSRGTESCWHPHHPDQVDQKTSPEWCYQRAKPLTQDRPSLDLRKAKFASYSEPPPWCPLPKVPQMHIAVEKEG